MTAWLSPQNSGPRRLPSAVTRPRSGVVAKASMIDRTLVSAPSRSESRWPRHSAPVPGRSAMILAPGAALGVDLEDELIRVEQTGVDQADQGQDVPAAVLDVEDDHCTDPRQPPTIDDQRSPARVRDDQVERHRDRGEPMHDLVDELEMVGVEHDADPRGSGDRDPVEGPPPVGVAGNSAAPLGPRREVGGRTCPPGERVRVDDEHCMVRSRAQARADTGAERTQARPAQPAGHAGPTLDGATARASLTAIRRRPRRTDAAALRAPPRHRGRHVGGGAVRA